MNHKFINYSSLFFVIEKLYSRTINCRKVCIGMRMRKFTHLKPKTLQEAISLLSQYRGKSKIIAGGTELVNRMKEKLIMPEYIIDITYIPGLDKIEYDAKSGLKIGAVCPLIDIEGSSHVKKKHEALALAVHTIGSVQVRNLGTIGGNLCNAAPSADSAPILIGLDAKARIFGRAGERMIELKDFFTGPGQTVLKPGEILVGIDVPNPPPRSAAVYIKQSIRKAMDLAVVGVAVVLSLSPDGSLADIRIVLGAVAPTPIRAMKAEAVIRGKKLDGELIREAARVASEEADPISDIRSSKEYRKDMVTVLTDRALQQTLEQVNRPR
jgi:aerobic carbon-monoxide dehydrogenase medium subunit